MMKAKYLLIAFVIVFAVFVYVSLLPVDTNVEAVILQLKGLP